MKILIVEDSKIVSEFLTSILNAKKYETEIAKTGKHAIQLIAEEKFNLILLDLHLPDMDGIDILKKIRDKQTAMQLPVVILSATTKTETIQQALDAKANDYIVKPFDSLTLLIKVSNLLLLQESNENLEKEIHKAKEAKDQFSAQAEELLQITESLENTNKILVENDKELKRVNVKLLEEQSIFTIGNVVVFKWENAENWPIQYVSKNVKNIFGYTYNEFISNKIAIADLIHPDDVERVTQETKRAIERGDNSFEHKEYRIITKNGTVMWLYDFVTILRNERGEVTHFYGYIRDVTKRIKAIHRLKNSELHYKTIISTTLSIISVLNKDGVLIDINQRSKNIHGYDREELIGNNANKLIHTDDLSLGDRILEKITSGEKDFLDTEIRMFHKNKETVWLHLNISKYPKISINQEEAVLVVAQDITKRKKMEFQLKEVNKSKDKFFSIISHDLKNPFNSLLGLLDLLIQRFDYYDDSKKKKLLKTLYKSSENTYKLLENLLEWSRTQSDKIEFVPEKINLNKTVFGIISFLQEIVNKKEIILSGDFKSQEFVFADKNMLNTVLRNLISNAIKFTPNKGQIIVSAKRQKDNKYIEISVLDTGVGIDSETIGNLFDIGSNTSTSGTNNEKGTGLGLILCKEFVEKNGGKIWVENELNKGSNFSFTLPVG